MWIVFSAYFCAILFACTLVCAFYNIHMYLRSGRWRVFSLSMFYLLGVICLILRIVVNILCVWIAQYFVITLCLFPAVIKFDIGVV